MQIYNKIIMSVLMYLINLMVTNQSVSIVYADENNDI